MAPDSTAPKIARNEEIFRRVNEGIRSGLWPEQKADHISFRCECARLECNQPVEVVVSEYERVRTNPRWFIVRPGHQQPEFETVVESHGVYVVVEKVGAAGEIAEELDPRS